MKTVPLVFSGTPVNRSPIAGLPDASYWAKYRVFANVYGFAIRPWMASNDISAGGASGGYKWTSAAGVPMPPGLFPLIAVCQFEGGGVDGVMVTDSSYRYFGGRLIESVDVYAPVTPSAPYLGSGANAYMGFIADLATHKGEAIFPNSRPRLRHFPLFQSDQWGGTTLASPYLQLTANAAFSGTVANPINFFGLNDDAVALATYNIVGGFFIFDGVKRWRVALRGTAQDVTIWTLGDTGNLSGTGLVPNEVIPSADWAADGGGAPVLVLEREANFVGEWIYLTANGATPGGAQNASPVYVVAGEIAVEL